ncbi:MAG: pyruvate kinase [Bryobacter sp.]|nr:pyruvate kinase [Bryobacter sp.]
MPSTKIVATLGPATDSPEMVKSLLEAGVDVFRLNASHGQREEHIRRIRLVREVARERGSHAGILLDLQGPKIRLGEFENGGCQLETGAIFTITTEQVMGNEKIASTSYAEFARDVRPGNQVLLNDGAVRLRVLSTDGVAARCEVVSGGPVSNRKGMNLPGVAVSTPSLTRKDKADLQAGLEEGVDYIAISFVRQPSDVLRLRHYLEEREAKVQVVSKIEKPEAVENLNAILAESDGVMVARGDLGVEMALEKVPAIQKTIITRARGMGKFVITATQMLESMIENATPTRAEVSDVANAIYDGTDAVMLSAETSVGKHAAAAAAYMDRIAVETEANLRYRGYQELPPMAQPGHAEIIADAAYRAGKHLGAAGIVVFTASGGTARLISRFRPPVPIYAFTPSEEAARQLAVIYGVIPIVAPVTTSTDEMLKQMDTELQRRGYIKPNDEVIFVSGQPIGQPGSTNMMSLHRVADIATIE